jgi:Spy/CpxP family protein refolding chaperone
MSYFSRRFILPVITAAAVFALPAFAQQGPDQNPAQGTTPKRGWARRGGQGQNHMAMLAKQLNLTDAQKQQFMQIGQSTRKQVMAIRKDSSLNDDQKKEKIQDARKQAHKQMFEVLTPEQREQLKQMRQQKQKVQRKEASPSAAGKKSGKPADDDPFAGMVSDDEDGPGNRV